MKTICDRIKSIRGELTQKEFAKKLGVSLGAVQYWEANEQIPKGDILLKFRNHFNIDLNWLLTGQGEPFAERERDKAGYQAIQSSNIIELQHLDLVRNFKDKPRAKAINQALLELERTSPSAFEAIEAYIKGMVSGIQLMVAEPQSSYSERRKKDAPENIPPGGDRRRGTDRRKAGGG